MPDLTYKAIVTEVKIAGQNAIFSAVVPANNDQAALTLSAIFPRESVHRIHVEDEIQLTVTFMDEEMREKAIQSRLGPF